MRPRECPTLSHNGRFRAGNSSNRTRTSTSVSGSPFQNFNSSEVSTPFVGFSITRPSATMPRRPFAPKPQLGPESKLDAKQRERLRELLLAGPIAAGFSTELWTCRRVAEVVRREFGVDYHPDHLGRILHDLGFSPQKPQRRASERNEAAIARWRSHDWPRIKKSRVAGTPSSSFSMNPAFVCSR